jgi:signal transduction histidine kinase/ActR/RegA family two-component response regulator
MRIAVKLNLAFMVLSIALSGFLGKELWQSYSAKQQAKATEERLIFLSFLSNTVHSLQIERGLSTSFLSTNITEEQNIIAQQLRDVYDISDQDIYALLRYSLPEHILSDQEVKQFNGLKFPLTDIIHFRQLVHQQNLDAQKVFSYYTHIIQQLLSLAPIATSLDDANRIAESLTMIAQLKEVAGQERATGGSILGQSTEFARADTVIRFIELGGMQKTKCDQLEKMLPTDKKPWLIEIKNSQNAENLRSYRHTIQMSSIDRTALANLSFDTWFTTASNRINEFKALEKHLSESMQAISRQNLSSASLGMFYDVISLLLILAIQAYIWFAVIRRDISRRLTTKVSHIAAIAKQMRFSARLIETPERDELNDVAHAINAVLENTDHAIQEVTGIASALSRADFSVRMQHHHLGDLAQLQETFNASLDQFNASFNAIKNTMKNVQDGNYNTRILIPMQGDLQNVKLGINHALDTINLKVDELKQAKRDADASNVSKSRFLATMSHEIRTPMNAILGLTEIILKSDLTQEQQQYMHRSYEAAQHLLTLINQILDLSQIEAQKITITPVTTNIRHLTKAVSSILGLTAEQKHLSLTYQVNEDIPEWLWLDDARLRQIIINLVGNAIKFTHHGGIHIQVSQEPSTKHLVISIKDTGIGIAANKLQHIFEPFTQADDNTNREFGGSGLGLSISQKIATLMNGTIAVSSQLGQGSNFLLRIPLVLPPINVSAPMDTTAQQPADTKLIASLHVLLVEDNAINQIVMKKRLSMLGVTQALAENGLAALELMQKTHFDLVLMDMQMPVMDGLTATRKLRAHTDWHQPIVIALTANAFAEDRAACMAAGMDDFLEKPVDEATITAMLSKYAVKLKQPEAS